MERVLFCTTGNEISCRTKKMLRCGCALSAQAIKDCPEIIA